MNQLAPICLFTYNRLEETKKTVAALQQNFLATASDLVIFSDGWKSEQGKEKIKNVRKYLKTITGFKSVIIKESLINNGLARSIINGVTEIINEHGKVIVLEDDLITAPNFLDFMNQGLFFYKKNTKIHSISGFSFLLPSLNSLKKDFYLGYRASSWGWATWKNRWNDIDWEVKNYETFKKSFQLKNAFRRGGNDLPGMLHHQMTGKIDSWAIRWCFHQFQKNQFTVHPQKSKVASIGFGSEATHTKKTKRFNTILDDSNKRTFLFDNDLEINKTLSKEHQRKFSIWARVKDRF
jgi:hypothetical protein